jgi:hypothetical protein
MEFLLWGRGRGAVLFFGIKEKVQLRGNMIELCKKSKIKQAAFFSFFLSFLAASALAKKYSSIV